MIKKLKTRFILLAMASLTVLLSFIVVGMNLINYETVISSADQRLELLDENSERIQSETGWNGKLDKSQAPPERPDINGNLGEKPSEKPDEMTGDYFGKDGPKGPTMSRDEAEEQRFFTVELGGDGNVSETNINRISSVDSEQAAEYAKKAVASGKTTGLIDDFRFLVKENNGQKRVTFLDCGRVLKSFKNFLKASITMSLTGLLAVFFVIVYFAGRIVRPVAESYEKQKRFITDAGHEIKTPLAIIKANIDLIGMELDGSLSLDGHDPLTEGLPADGVADIKDSVGDINTQVDRLTGLTNDLVYLSRMEEAGGNLVMTEIPLSDTVLESVSAIEPLAAEKGKRIIADVEPMITVKGSGKELEKLMSILLENAIKYSALSPASASEESDADGNEAVIHASLHKDSKSAVIELRNDSETELSNEALSHVFDRFYRTDSSRNSETGGHGIGLSMAKAIVDAHGGKISAYTTNGHDFIISAGIPLA